MPSSSFVLGAFWGLRTKVASKMLFRIYRGVGLGRSGRRVAGSAIFAPLGRWLGDIGAVGSPWDLFVKRADQVVAISLCGCSFFFLENSIFSKT